MTLFKYRNQLILFKIKIIEKLNQKYQIFKKMVKAKENKGDKNFIFIASFIVIVIILLWIFTLYNLKDIGYNERGTFGDMFGGLNALFSGLAFAGIILTILLQRNELKLQRKELKETRAEFKTQNETLKIQRFEHTFFNLLDQHHQIVNAIDFRYYKNKEMHLTRLPTMKETHGIDKEVVVIHGRDVFRYLYRNFNNELELNPSEYENIYLKHYENAQTDLGHYFRNLYRMIKHVDQTNFFNNDSAVSENDIFEIKYKYTSFIRAQISDYELLWLFYNCLSINGSEKFKPLIETYSLFKNIPRKLIVTSHLELYNQRAFEVQ